MRDEPERLELGPDIVESDGPRRRLPKWWPLVAIAVVLFIVIANQSRDSKSSSEPEPTPSPTTSEPSATPSFTPSAEPTSSVAVEEVGHPLLGVTDGWELFGRGDGVVVRIELAEGRVTKTTIPGLMSGGPVSFIVTPGSALVRPLDFVAGYVVPDGLPAEHAPLVFSGGFTYPGPDPQHIWIVDQTNQTSTVMSLVDLDGNPTGTTIAVPPGTWLTSDGAGYLLVSDTGGVYEARPEGLRRVTTGVVLAIGPTRWMVWECDDRHSCEASLIDRTNGVRSTFGNVSGDPTAPRGVISPDGSVAALIGPTAQTADTLRLVDLVTITERSLKGVLDPRWSDQGMVFSPDSRWLFVIGGEGKLVVVDTRTAQIIELGVNLPPLRQLAIRTP